MQLKYFFFTLCTAAFPMAVFAQNRPLLSETAAPGTVSNMLTPPEVTIGSRLNTVITYNVLLPISDANSIGTGIAPASAKVQQVFMDGSGRPFQSITRNVATADGQAKHLIQVFDNGTQKDQYNFLPFVSNNSSLQTGAFQKQRDYYAGLYPDEGYTAFSKSVNTSDNASRTQVSFAPGKSQVGQSRGTNTRLMTNAANEVRIWGLDGNGLPVSSGYYPAGELFGSENILPANAAQAYRPKTMTYNDREGKLILKMVTDSTYATMFGGLTTYSNTYLYTYYVYNAKGKLVHTITPKAYQYFLDNGSLPSTVVQSLCFSNLYDSKGRVIGSRKPGEGDYTWFVYDRKNRIVMQQTPKEATVPEWEVTFYDPLDRIKATSIFTNGPGNTRDKWQMQVDSSGNTTSINKLFYYLCTDAGEIAYPYSTSPYSLSSLVSGNTVMTYNWYDRYDIADFATYWTMCNDQLQFSGDLLSTPGAEIPKRSNRVLGMLTVSMARVLRSQNASLANLGDWNVALNYYDDKGRVINSVSFTDREGPATGKFFNFDFTGTQYDFAGRALITKHVTYKHNVPNGQVGYTHKELFKNVYDATSGSLTTALHKVDGGPWATISKISYDDMGRLKRKDLGGGGEIQDYTYNIRGQLTGINGRYAETGYKDGLSKTFGESLKYDYGFTTPHYDGKIAGMVWRGASASDMFAYGYDYTQNLSLKQADFSHRPGGTAWINTDLDYSVSNLFYDKNGNIKSMKQRGQKPGTGPVDMDNLTYGYEANSNRLSQVSDAGITYYGAGDFKDAYSGVDYSYDLNGNLAKDRNRTITAFSYTRFNKPDMITLSDASTIEYSYDAAGNKLEEIITPRSGPYKRTDYIGNCVYQNTTVLNNTADNLKYMLTPEGRMVFDPLSVSAMREEFFVKDHLGNVRSTINTLAYDTRRYAATFEVASANLENLVWDALDEVRDDKPGGGGDNTMAANLNGADPNRRVGSSILVHVMAGDKVSMSVNTLYNGGYIAEEDNPVPAEQALDAIVSTLTGGIGGVPGEGHDTKLVTDVFTNDNFSVFNDILNNNTDPAKPRAYLNYILFDENMQIVSEMTGAFQADGNNTWATIGTANALEVPRNGYLALYLSNNSQVSPTCIPCSDVYFDNFNFTVTKGQLLEETHYYPFGLPIQGISSVTADGFTENRHKYQGNELIKDLQLNLMDFQARQYDPQIGRFLSIDPLAALGGQDMFSPYAAMGNAPESVTDPNGLTPILDKSYMSNNNTWMSVRVADGGQPIGASRAGGQGRDAWADGGFGIDSYGSISGFGNGMDAGVARWSNAQAIRSLVSFTNSILSIGGTQNFAYNTETGKGQFWGGSADQEDKAYDLSGDPTPDPDPQKGSEEQSKKSSTVEDLLRYAESLKNGTDLSGNDIAKMNPNLGKAKTIVDKITKIPNGVKIELTWVGSLATSLLPGISAKSGAIIKISEVMLKSGGPAILLQSNTVQYKGKPLNMYINNNSYYDSQKGGWYNIFPNKSKG